MAGVAWSLAAAITAVSALAIFEQGRRGELGSGPAAVLGAILEGLLPVVFSALGALIISNQPANVIGWLFMIPGVGAALVAPISVWVASFENAPDALSPGLWMAIWFENWSWVTFMFPIFHLLQVFPTGRVLTPRWRWLSYLEIGMFVTFVGLITVSAEMGAAEGTWTVVNPIGFVPMEIWDNGFSLVWTVGLLVLVLGGTASMVIRFRRGRGPERQQLKWLLYVLVIFVMVYSVSAVRQGSGGAGVLGDLAFHISVLAIPVAIAVAVLRYRLFDIDLIIRKTLVYGLLTGLLAVVYFGSVVVLQSVFRGEGNSSVSVAASTLIITASFSPLRRRVQTLIDRRLYRSKYHAQQVIERFGSAAQNEANLETLSDDLMAVVAATIQPRSGVLWIKEPA